MSADAGGESAAGEQYPHAEAKLDAATGVERRVWEALRTVEDPELPVSIVDLGIVYAVRVDGDDVEVDLTLTYSGCPARDLIVADAEAAIREVDAVDDADVRVVYSPTWGYDMITPTGRRELNEWGMAVPGDAEAPDPECRP